MTIAATGGTGALQYSLDGTYLQVSNVFDKQTDGSFTISVKDNNGCIATKQATLAKSVSPKITSTQPTPTTSRQRQRQHRYKNSRNQRSLA
ncbi:MAG: hypothetical protein R2822_07320 [Spirosomataceae bacterium]